MKKIKLICLAALLISSIGCGVEKKTEVEKKEKETPFLWNSANLYFMLTDRFNNGDTANDINFDRTKEAAKFRGFMGGDIKGVIQKLEAGYFEALGINAIWMTPVFEQIHGSVDEGTGNTYGFHGYWIKDWTRLDPNFGTEEEFAQLIALAHNKGIRVLMDVVINHTGPVTEQDPRFDSSWVRTSPQCTYQDYETTIPCTLVKNLPDVLTESNESVKLPAVLVAKFKQEGRYEQEMASLEEFFAKTGHPRAPRFYIMKWLVDFVEKYGVDGYRVDTAKHVEEGVWVELAELAKKAFEDWKSAHPEEVLDTNSFHMLGEVYNYLIDGGQQFDFGDRIVNYYEYGFNSMVNFSFKSDATKDYETIFSKYDSILQNHMGGNTVVNYVTSHDDGSPFDKQRIKPIEAGTKLLLAPGISQVYYGDETTRKLDYPETEGDATLRSFMNWNEINDTTSRNGYLIKDVLAHYQKLGVFRKEHVAVGGGRHTMLSQSPYVFKRELSLNGYSDKVIVGLDLETGVKEIAVEGVFENGVELYDYYSNQNIVVVEGNVVIDSDDSIVLLGVK